MRLLSLIFSPTIATLAPDNLRQVRNERLPLIQTAWPVRRAGGAFADTMSEPPKPRCPGHSRRVDAAGLARSAEDKHNRWSPFLQIRSGGRVGGHHADPLHDLLAGRADLTPSDSFLPPGKPPKGAAPTPAVACAHGRMGTTLPPQLEEAAELAGLDPTAAIAPLSQTRVRVLTIGFAPASLYGRAAAELGYSAAKQGLTKSVPAGAVDCGNQTADIFTNASAHGMATTSGKPHSKTFRPRQRHAFALSPGTSCGFPPFRAGGI